MTAVPATSDTGRASPRVGLGGVFRIVLPILLLVGAWEYMGPEQFVNALTRGAIYALIALGYTMVYGIIELINFAHGDMFMVGAFVSLSFLDLPRLHRRDRGLRLLAVVLFATFVVTMGVMGVIGVLIERFAYKPLRRRPAPRAADHRDRRVVHPPEHRPAVLRPVPDELAEDLPGHLVRRDRRGDASPC